ncbi:MAG: NADH-quinone oxidoreductase subunit [Bacteroidota bacterium]|jgi:NADH-quinone oxidoreductase subunit L
MNHTIQLAVILGAPFIGFLINGLAGKRLPHAVSGLVACGALLLAFLLSLMIFLSGETVSANFMDWLPLGNTTIGFSFVADPLSQLMLLIVTGVGFLIHVYSTGYMHDDEGFAKFLAYLNLFIFFMLILVLGANFPMLFIGWEGVGLCSFLLIGFWYKNANFTAAAQKAFVMNRIGDLGFLIGMFLIYSNFGTLNFAETMTSASTLASNSPVLVAITICLFIGAIGKSAQLPLFTWLPDAMAGPTPVSALIHAATMVTAGVYMIARCNVLFTLAPTTGMIITVIGAATAIVAATIALFQNDIKKVLAYSTVSQLGFMFVAMGLGAYTAGMFHVMTHAFFKALLFLGSGTVIHALHGEQDMSRYGGLGKHLKGGTQTLFIIATLAIAGIAPFAGFFSKDEILLHAFETNTFIWLTLTLGSVLTAFYMGRLLFLTFWGEYRGDKHNLEHLHQPGLNMVLPLVVLGILSVVGGFVGVPEVFGLGKPILHEFLHPVFALSTELMPHEEAMNAGTEMGLMGLAMGLAFAALGFAYSRFAKAETVENAAEMGGVKGFLGNKWYVDELYDMLFVKPIKYLSEKFYTVIDKQVIDGAVTALGDGTLLVSRAARLVQSGSVGTYLTGMIFGVLLLFAIFLFM